MSLNQLNVHDARQALRDLHRDVQERWNGLAKVQLHMSISNPDRKRVEEQMLELAFERRGLVAAIASINGLSVGLPLGTKVYNYRVDRSVAGEGVVVHPREVGGEYEDSVVDEWDIADDFLEMIPVRWHEGESAIWVYFDDLARVPEL